MMILSTSSPISQAIISQTSSQQRNPIQASTRISPHVEALNLLLKRPWDPFSTVIKQSKAKKLKYDPIFLIVPCAPPWGDPVSNRRTKLLLSYLNAVGKVKKS